MATSSYYWKASIYYRSTKVKPTTQPEYAVLQANISPATISFSALTIHRLIFKDHVAGYGVKSKFSTLSKDETKLSYMCYLKYCQLRYLCLTRGRKLLPRHHYDLRVFA